MVLPLLKHVTYLKVCLNGIGCYLMAHNTFNNKLPKGFSLCVVIIIALNGVIDNIIAVILVMGKKA